MTLSSRIVVGVCFFAVLLTGGFLVGGKVVLNRVEGALLLLSGDNVTAAAQAVLQRSERVLTANGRTLARNRDAIAALAEGDFEAVTEGLTSTFNRIAASGEISDLLVFDADGHVVSSFSSASEAAPVAELPDLVNTVRETGRRNFDISRIDENRYGAAYAFPLLKGRTPVGYAMLALDVQSTLPDIASTIGGSALLTSVSSQGEPALAGFAGAPLADSTADAENTADTLEITTTPEEMASAILSVLRVSESDVGAVEARGRNYVVARYHLGPIADDANLELFLISDFTDAHGAKTEAIRIALTALGSCAALFLFLMLAWLRRELRPLKEITSALLAVTRGEMRERNQTKRAAREIADLESALETFMTQTGKLAEESKRSDQQAKEIAQQAGELEAQARNEAEKRIKEAEGLAEDARLAEEIRVKEQDAAAEISAVVEACANGDFSRRLRTGDKEGVFSEICEKVNQIGEEANKGLEAVRTALSHLQKGDLTYRMPENLHGVFGEIAEFMNAMAESLARTMIDISASSNEVDGSARELSGAANDLAVRTEQNAAKLEETAAAIEEMSAAVKSAARSAEEARADIESISRKAEVGQDLMSRAVTAMDEIRASSNSIGKILDVLEEISFQTNLLALNAGVEAARAGDAGRGFAVVASEVRALAHRSADSASEISALIETSGKNVERGATLVQESGHALKEIVSGVTSAAQKIHDIVMAAQETADGIGELSSTTNELDKSTQQNAAIFEETSAAVQILEAQAEALTASVAAFTIDPGARSPAEGDSPDARQVA